MKSVQQSVTQRIAEKVIIATQLFWYLLFVIPLRLLYRATPLFQNPLDYVRPGTLLVSNHQSMLDPFIALGYLPLKTFRKLLPIRFPVMSRFMRKWYLKPLLLLGCYDIGATKRERMIGLLRTKTYLRRNQSLMIFPEGKVSKSGALQDLQQGILFLAETNHPVMFAKFENFHITNLRSFIWSPDRRITFNHLIWEENLNVEPAVFKSYLQ